MKKIKIISIVTIFILLVIAIIYTNNRFASKNNYTVAKTSNADLTFGVFGDIHDNITHLQNAINDFYTIDPNMDALILNGDVVDQGLDNQYYSVEKALSKNKNLLPKIIIKNIGNHEFFDYNIEINSKEQVQDFINKYLEFAGEKKVYHDSWIKDYHFISLGSEDGNSETINSVTAFLSNEQIQWFKEKLAEKYEKGKPIFVFLHQHLEYPNSSWVGVEQAEELREILSEYPEVILFSSHTHRDIDKDSVSLNKPFTIINTGAIHYTLVIDSNEERGVRMEENYVNGIYVEVNGNDVTIKGRDIKEKKWRYDIEVSK
ncbi:metallophosphoesterase [Clostridium sp. AL.422]|uniref:metallophosphoesterase family protein n=1 Tax=Clostridium TaxID=1485 RepID=UPI00293DDC63|nr:MULTISPECIES: metallophosphoesterase [unclassified Clostridium]MDV4149299.1 metallophosphoesterase [Clostridium sp. AL.422]